MEFDINSLIAQKIISLTLADQSKVMQALAAFGSGLLGNNFGEALIKEGLLTNRQMEKVYSSLQAVPWEENQALFQFLQYHSHSYIDFSTLEKAYQFARQNQLSLGQALVKTRVLSVKAFLQLRERLQKEALHCKKCNRFYMPDYHQEVLLCPCGEMLMRMTTQTLKKDSRAQQKFGEYQILSEIARGGMGIVFRARHPSHSREVALKVLLQQEGASETTFQRFLKEAQTAQKLTHPNIVGILDYGEVQGVPFLAMDYIEGKSLKEVIQEDPSLGLSEKLSFVYEVVLAMDYAHQQKIIHRDLKTANIMIDQQGKPWITDFGLAKDLESDTMLTQSGIKIGTPAYMAPEQASGQSKYANTLTDIYQLGVMVFNIFTGELPYRAKTPAELFYKIINEAPPDPRDFAPDLPPSLTYICSKAMAKNPEGRYQTAKAMAEDLRKVMEGKPVESAPKKKTLLKETISTKTSETSVIRRRRPQTTPPSRLRSKSSSQIWLYIILGTLVLLFLLLFYFWWSGEASPAKTRTSKKSPLISQKERIFRNKEANYKQP